MFSTRVEQVVVALLAFVVAGQCLSCAQTTGSRPLARVVHEADGGAGFQPRRCGAHFDLLRLRALNVPMRQGVRAKTKVVSSACFGGVETPPAGSNSKRGEKPLLAGSAGAPAAAPRGDATPPASSESPQTSDHQSPPSDSPDTTIFHHPSGRFWLSGQINIISQGNFAFPAAYSGPNSFGPRGQIATSRILTLYTGAELGHETQVIVDIETAGGHGLSGGGGIAGFTDLDIVRTPNLGQAPYLARFLVEKTISLGGREVENDRNYLSLPASLPARRVELWVGKFSTVDFFDVNPVGSDSHLQFLNWAVDNNAAFDYAANTRGYTWGAIVQWIEPRWALRFGEGMMPKVANGENLDADLGRAHSENIELELDPALLRNRPTSIRLLSYVNHADMGNYRDAVDAFLSGETQTPDIVLDRRQGRVKYGFGVNVYQDAGYGVRLFGRLGWNDGRTESFAYTEVDRTASFGGDVAGSYWHRRLDRFGAAFDVDAISGDHRRYLALGGKGFMLGDGGLSYGLEKIFETYYTAHLWRGVYGAVDLQHVTNPGYNRARGPVLVPSLRLHVDF